MSFLSTLLDKNDRPVRIASGEALALIFEIGSLEKFCGESKVSGHTCSEGNDCRKTMYINGLKTKVINQMRDLSAEAGGRGSVKKDLINQRNTFRDILNFLEVCECWCQITRLNSSSEMLNFIDLNTRMVTPQKPRRRLAESCYIQVRGLK